MNRRRLFRVGATLAVALWAGTSRAPTRQAWAGGPGTAGLQYLQMGSGARQAGMGEAFTAVGDDVNTVHWNPAGLALLRQHEVSLSYNRWVADMSDQGFAYVAPLSPMRLAVHGRYFRYGDIAKTDAAGGALGSFGSSDLALGMSSAFKVTRAVSAGATVRWLRSALDDVTANTVSADFGGTVQMTSWLRAGGAVQHLGPGMTYVKEVTPLPTTIKTGLAARMLGGNLGLAVDASKPLAGEWQYYAGAEFRIREVILLRSGMHLGNAWAQAGSAGLGLRLGDRSVDYAFTPISRFGATHRITLSSKFGR